MKNLVVPLDATDLSVKTLDAALLLAERFSAHLTGVYTEQSIDFTLYGGSFTAAMYSSLQKQIEKEKSDVKAAFDKQTASLSSICSFKTEPSYSRDGLLSIAATSDLIIAGQPDSKSRKVDNRNYPEHLVMASGRPVLIVPNIVFPETMGENVMVAWDHSREAARAIHDALPILKTARTVHLLSVVGQGIASSEVVAADMAEHLSRHDVRVEIHPTIKTEIPVAETMLARAADWEIDLIVMGAYGHSRLREYAFGGTTRTMLNSMTLPVLMAH